MFHGNVNRSIDFFSNLVTSQQPYACYSCFSKATEAEDVISASREVSRANDWWYFGFQPIMSFSNLLYLSS